MVKEYKNFTEEKETKLQRTAVWANNVWRKMLRWLMGD